LGTKVSETNGADSKNTETRVAQSQQ